MLPQQPTQPPDEPVILVLPDGNELHTTRSRAIADWNVATKAQPAPASAAVTGQESPSRAAAMQGYQGLWDTGANLAKGAVKGVLTTGSNLANMAATHGLIPGVTPEMAAGRLEQDRAALETRGTAQAIGKTAEQIGEFFIPGAEAEKASAWITAKLAPHLSQAPGAVRAMLNLLPKMAAQGAASATVAKAQGGGAITAGAIGAVAPVVGAVGGAAVKAIGNQAVPLVRAAIKPTVTASKQTAGASVEGLNAVAERLSKFILDRRLTSPQKAEDLIKAAERELQTAIQANNALTDAPQRAARYLKALERSAGRQGLPAADVAQIRSAAKELLATSPLAKDVVTMVPKPSVILGPNGQPLTTMQPVTTRTLRSDVKADESLEIGRATGRWANRKSYGELKGADQEASKAVERAARDSMKDVVPGAKEALGLQSQAIQAKGVLDRMAFRQANRDAVSLPAHVIAAGEIASGKLPVLAMAANWLRNNQMKAGIYADQLAKAMERGDKTKTAFFLRRLGVAVPAEAMK